MFTTVCGVSSHRRAKGCPFVTAPRHFSR